VDDVAPLEDEFSFDDGTLLVTTFFDLAEAAGASAAEFSHGCLLEPLPPGSATWSVFWIDCNTLCTL